MKPSSPASAVSNKDKQKFNLKLSSLTKVMAIEICQERGSVYAILGLLFIFSLLFIPIILISVEEYHGEDYWTEMARISQTTHRCIKENRFNKSNCLVLDMYSKNQINFAYKR